MKQDVLQRVQEIELQKGLWQFEAEESVLQLWGLAEALTNGNQTRFRKGLLEDS